LRFKYSIKSANIGRLPVSGDYAAIGTLKHVGKDGSFEVPGGGAGEHAFFTWNLTQQERVTVNKQINNTKKLALQTERIAQRLGLGNTDNLQQEPKHRDPNK
jgi:hypothetical protein